MWVANTIGGKKAALQRAAETITTTTCTPEDDSYVEICKKGKVVPALN
jgi:hypothetical protein